MTTIDASDLLKNGPQYKPITVEKDDDLKYDLGRLCAFDFAPLDQEAMKKDATQHLIDLSRDNVQLLFTHIFQLPTKVVPDGVLAELPSSSSVLPRSLPLPEDKPQTTWDKFAATKGIRKIKSREKLVWDEQNQDYRRRYGYKKANDDGKQWLIPHNEHDKSGVDPFTKMAEEKKEKKEKQKSKELKNKKSAQLERSKAQGARNAKQKDDISRTFALVSRSTASLGKFDRRLPGEDSAPKIKGTRKLANLQEVDVSAEKSKSLGLLNKMFSKEDTVDTEKAGRNFTREKQREAHKRNKEDLISGQAFKKQRR
eukprot:TRINITY_DN907_c0_g1_i1.p1 TRINITY_DN907_c0_g1~~TRINITY_DN907_c0_g1_i1.p1  ORF type:complete len:312 (+),score=96.92 TRINITY_DN907_c0_g1_i1:120-1055(+)